MSWFHIRVNEVEDSRSCPVSSRRRLPPAGSSTAFHSFLGVLPGWRGRQGVIASGAHLANGPTQLLPSTIDGALASPIRVCSGSPPSASSIPSPAWPSCEPSVKPTVLMHDGDPSSWSSGAECLGSTSVVVCRVARQRVGPRGRAAIIVEENTDDCVARLGRVCTRSRGTSPHRVRKTVAADRRQSSTISNTHGC